MVRIQNPFTPGERVETNPTSDGKFKLATRSQAVITRVKAISPLQGLCIIEHRPSPKVLGPKGKVTLLPGKVGIQLCHTFGRANALQGELVRMAFLTCPLLLIQPPYRCAPSSIIGEWTKRASTLIRDGTAF